jgi:DNA polymerase-3 subunit delta
VELDVALARAKRGDLLPVYVIAGTERYLASVLVGALREAALAGGLAELNEDKFTAGETSIDKVLSAARTVPMMGKRRFIVIRNADKWDASEGEASPLDQLADYAKKPIDSTVLVVLGEKLDKRRKLVALARKEGFYVECQPLAPRDLPRFVVEQARARGNVIDEDAAALVAELAGPELGPVVDAVERLSLYVGPNKPIDEDAVAACVTRMRTADAWQLVDAVGRRDLGSSLRLFADVYDPRDRGLPLLGLLAWSVRQLARVQAAMEAGASADEAARRAGVPPFRIRDVTSRARQIPVRDTLRWLSVLAETDLALKGSKRPPNIVLEDMLARLCKR